ncbi:MAG: serine/threonine-protein kinase [Myxococcota bacterium]
MTPPSSPPTTDTTDTTDRPTCSVEAPSPSLQTAAAATPARIKDDERAPLPPADALARPTKARPTHSATGTFIGPYLVIDTLGAGGMGRVYRAFDRTLDRQVALKVLHRGLASHDRTRLVVEARAMAQLSHPNVVQVYEVGDHRGQAFVVMELVDGQTLRQWMRQEPRPDWRTCVRVFRQAGAGLAAAHEHEIVHRDFKPSNVLIDPHGRVRVLDFGLALTTTESSTSRSTDDAHASDSQHSRKSIDQRLTKTGMVVGTPAYMSPEQMRRAELDARSDQFSFCVSLFEAVYGQRPFEGETLDELQAKIRSGTTKPILRKTKIPTTLHEILMRGLAFDPQARWPSMKAVLDALERLVDPRRYRRWVLGASMGLGLTALGTGLAYQAEITRQAEHARELERAKRCSGAHAELMGVWDDDRRAQVQAALLDTQRSYAAQTEQRVRSRLDDYADAWTQAHTEACEATSIRHEQSQEVMDLRMQCLHERKVALAAAVDVLAGANADVVAHAVEVASSMPRLDRCHDIRWLQQRQQRIPPPEDPAVAEQAQALRQRLSMIQARHEAGQYDEALEQALSVVEHAEALDYGPLVAEALLQRGHAHDLGGHYEQAQSDLERAFTVAAKHGHDAVAAHAVIALTMVVGYEQVQLEPGLGWARTALALSRGPELDGTVEAAALNSFGAVLRQQESYDQSLQHHQRALAIEAQALGPDHPQLAKTLGNIGMVLTKQGKFDEALAYHRRVLAIEEHALGPQHPNNGSTLGNIGNSLYQQGKLDQALDYHHRALAIFEQAFDPAHPKIIATWGNIGFVLQQQGKLDQALERYRQVVAMQEQALGPDHPTLAAQLLNIGNVLDQQGKLDQALEYHHRALTIFERSLGPEHPHVARALGNIGFVFRRRDETDPALEYFRRALTIFERSFGSTHPDYAMTLVNIGTVLNTQGRRTAAQDHLRRALRIYEQTLPPKSPHLVYPLVELADLALVERDANAARAHAERAVSILEAGEAEPNKLAQARFLLARALWPDHAQRARARALAQQAHEAWTTAGSDSDDQRRRVEAWLATHRLRPRRAR